MTPQIQTSCSDASRITGVVLAMLSAASSRSLPMARFRRAAIARGALPVWAEEASSANTTIADMVAGIFDSPAPSDVSAQVGRAGLVGVEAVTHRPSPGSAAYHSPGGAGGCAGPAGLRGRRCRPGSPRWPWS